MLNDHIKRTVRTIDEFLENYTLGTLIVDGDTVSLETKSGEIVLDESYVIEVFAGGKYHPITYDKARNTMSSDGWPLYAGLEARVKKKEVKQDVITKCIRLQNIAGSHCILHT
jgi:hypothetical protein